MTLAGLPTRPGGGHARDWAALTRRTLAGIDGCEPVYRPTSFWAPGVRRLLGDLETRGLESFKDWPSARDWFLPVYGPGFTEASMDQAFEAVARANPAVSRPWLWTSLTGAYQARRDFDAVRLAWDQARWPCDLDGLGESPVGDPPQLFRLSASDHDIGWTRPYLNYLLCLAGLSRHVDAAPRTFLEIGGGYGVLGEIVMSRDAGARYVNLDLPPLVTVSSWYLDTLFPGRVMVFDDAIADTGPIEIPGSAVLPNWRIGDVAGPFDVFVNSFSFQEMEPNVVEHYIGQVAAREVTYAVSLNSRAGKPTVSAGNEIGVVEAVTSDGIVAMFEGHGYDLVGRYGDPLLQASGELVILRRRGPGGAIPARPAGATSPHAIDQRAPGTIVADARTDHPGSAVARLARDWLPPKVLRAARRLRRRAAGRIR